MFNALNWANLTPLEITSVVSNPNSANGKYGIEKIRDSINSLRSVLCLRIQFSFSHVTHHQVRAGVLTL